MATKYNITFPTKNFFVEVLNSKNQMIMRSKQFMDYSHVHKFIDFLELLEDDYTFVIKNTNMMKQPVKPARGNFKRQKNDLHFTKMKYQKPPVDTKNEPNSDTEPQLGDSEIEDLLNILGEDDNDNIDHLNHHVQEWSILDENKKYDGCYIKKYGRGYHMTGNNTMSFYKQKYLPENRKHNIAWWDASNKCWFLKKESLQYFVDNGARMIS